MRKSGGNLTSYQREILGFIAAESAQAGACMASKSMIARSVGCSEKTVDRAMRHLRSTGLIVVESRFGEDGSQQANVYRIAV